MEDLKPRSVPEFKEIEVYVGQTGRMSRVKVRGVDISDLVQKIVIESEVQDISRITLTMVTPEALVWGYGLVMMEAEADQDGEG